jgi:hypothetical protein
MTRIPLAVGLVFFAALAPAAQARPVGTFVGKDARLAIGVVMDERTVRAYACDGRRLGEWFDKRARGSSVRLGGRVRLTTRAGTVSMRFRGRTVTLHRATGRAGLYRADSARGGKRRLGGWVVQRSGSQIGTLATQGVIGPAPQLSTTTLTTSAGGAVLSAGVVLPPGPQAVIADPANDGFDLSGRVSSAIAGGGLAPLRWTRPADDDVFIALDTAVLGAAGYRLSTGTGAQLSGTVLARGGLVLRDPRGVSTTTSDGVQLVHLLDSNRDGAVTRSDPAGNAIREFRDANGDGRLLLEEAAEALRNDRDRYKTTFEEFDRRQNELFTLLSSIVKTTAQVRTAGVALSAF